MTRCLRSSFGLGAQAGVGVETERDKWVHFLSQLRVVAVGADAGPDDWVPIDDRKRTEGGTP